MSGSYEANAHASEGGCLCLRRISCVMTCSALEFKRVSGRRTSACHRTSPSECHCRKPCWSVEARHGVGTPEVCRTRERTGGQQIGLRPSHAVMGGRSVPSFASWQRRVHNARRDCIRGQETSKTIPGATSRSTHPVRPLPGPAGGHLFGPCVAAAGLAMGTGLRSLPDRTEHVAEAKSHLRSQCAPAPGLCCNALVVAHELRGCARTTTLKSSTDIAHRCCFLRFQDIGHTVCATEMPVHARKGNCIHLLGSAAQDLSSAFAATARPAFRDRAARLFAKSPCALQRRLHRRQSLSSPRWSLSSLSSSATRARRSLHASGTFLRRPYRVNDLQDDMCIRTELPPALRTDGTWPSAILSLSLYRMMWRSLRLWSAT